MKLKFASLILCVTMLLGVLSSCSKDVSDEVIAQTETMTYNDYVKQRIAEQTADEQTRQVLSYITNSVKIDIDDLLQADNKTQTDIKAKIDDITAFLGGEINEALDPSLANYMLTEFVRTPYVWQLENVDVLGYDAATRLYFADVTYTTTDTEKVAIQSSSIPKGMPLASAYTSERYESYIEILEMVYGGSNNFGQNTNLENAQIALEKWEEKWGKLTTVLESQNGITMLQRTRSFKYGTWSIPSIYAQLYDPTSINTSNEVSSDTSVYDDEFIGDEYYQSAQTSYDMLQYQPPHIELAEGQAGGITFSGLCPWLTLYDDDEADKRIEKTDPSIQIAEPEQATMTYRFVFDYSYVLGAATTLNLVSFYQIAYDIADFDEWRKDTLSNVDYIAVETLIPIMKEKVLSYSRCLDTGNYTGLYSLFGDFGSVDKYYEAQQSNVYQKHGSFTMKVLRREESRIWCEVVQSVKTRGIGSRSDYPNYTDTYIMQFGVTSENDIRITDVDLIKRELIGEPLNVIRNVTSVSNQIMFDESTFTVTNEKLVNELIGQLSVAQLNGAGVDSGFYELLDLSVTQEQLTDIMEAVTRVGSNSPQKTVWITQWETKSNSYAKLIMRELFAAPDKGDEKTSYESEAVLELINRDGKWLIVNYARNFTIEGSQTIQDINNSKSLLVATPDKYTFTVSAEEQNASETGLEPSATPSTDAEMAN